MFITPVYGSRTTSVFYITKKGVVKRLKSAKTSRLMEAVELLVSLNVYAIINFVSTQKGIKLNQVFMTIKTTTHVMYNRTSCFYIEN